ELGADRHAAGIIGLAEDLRLRGALTLVAPPDDEEAPAGIHGHDGMRLVTGRVGVDAELATLRSPRDVVALAEDLGVRAIAVTLPDHDEVARAVGGDGRPMLVARGVGVDPELGPADAA